MKFMFAMVATVLATLLVNDLQAGLKTVVRQTSRQSSYTQASNGTVGHQVAIPVGVFEGVGVASTRREAIRIACNNGGKVLHRSTHRDSNGMFHSSVIRRNR